MAARSTAAAFPQRAYRIAEPDAWSQRIEVEGFAAPVWQTAAGGAPPATPKRRWANAITLAFAQRGAPSGT